MVFALMMAGGRVRINNSHKAGSASVAITTMEVRKLNPREQSLNENVSLVGRTLAVARIPWRGFCLHFSLQLCPISLRCILALFTWMSLITLHSICLNLNLPIVSLFFSLLPKLDSVNCGQ